ncbi:hypothetical protein MRB53_037332 [Persea americana]|nr:hypothetical protein MRB53_037332 [Persea americana]
MSAHPDALMDLSKATQPTWQDLAPILATGKGEKPGPTRRPELKCNIDSDSLVFLIIGATLTPNRLSGMMEHVFTAPEACSVVERAMVYGAFAYMCSEQATANRCVHIPWLHAKLSECIDQFPLQMPCTVESVLALKVAQLGWHRGDFDYETEEELRAKKQLFFNIYYFDKALSLRLGRSSTLQDYAIQIEPPEPSTDPRRQSWDVMSNIMTDIATLQGLVFERLYSPGSFSQSRTSRQDNVSELLSRCQAIVSRLTGLACLLTQILRASPDQGLSHSPSAANVSCFKDYYLWTVFSSPFTPYMVVVCHAVTALDLEDVKLMEEFAASLDELKAGEWPDSSIRFKQICLDFLRLAKAYISAKMRSDSPHAVAMSGTIDSKDFSMFGMDSSHDARGPQSCGIDSSMAQPHSFGVYMDPATDMALSSAFDWWLPGQQDGAPWPRGDLAFDHRPKPSRLSSKELTSVDRRTSTSRRSADQEEIGLQGGSA